MIAILCIFIAPKILIFLFASCVLLLEFILQNYFDFKCTTFDNLKFSLLKSSLKCKLRRLKIWCISVETHFVLDILKIMLDKSKT